MAHIKILFAIVLAIVFFCISLIVFLYILSPAKVKNCIQGQKEEIYRIDDLLKRAKDTGNEFREPFEMKWCTQCIWYNSADSSLQVIFYEEKEPVGIPVDSGWVKFNGKENSLISPGWTYLFYIKSYGISECFNCEGHVGECPIGG